MYETTTCLRAQWGFCRDITGNGVYLVTSLSCSSLRIAYTIILSPVLGQGSFVLSTLNSVKIFSIEFLLAVAERFKKVLFRDR